MPGSAVGLVEHLVAGDPHAEFDVVREDLLANDFVLGMGRHVCAVTLGSGITWLRDEDGRR